jgi:alkanesulfonate monooxygenase SsuD/methylene tetrahydromethanopterin reductase-like flavin-dependent oxidoreductase (luciferase family)
MRYGFYLPTRGPTATRGGILALAREGERLGLHSAMIADHIVLPVEDQSTYPYTLDGKHPSMGDALETFSILGVVAGATERLRLVTSVLVLPYRNPVLTAKMAASLDVLSGGRLTLGVGAGWLKEEFEALNSPAFNARGAVTDGARRHNAAARAQEAAGDRDAAPHAGPANSLGNAAAARVRLIVWCKGVSASGRARSRRDGCSL